MQSEIKEEGTLSLIDYTSKNNHILRQPATDVTFPLDDETKKIISNLKKFVGTLNKVAGLAAPQVGISLRVILFQVTNEALQLRKDANEILPLTILINPSYVPIESDGKVKDWEGCFSVQNKLGEVYRYKKIKYEGYDLDGNKISGIAEGFLARLIQHEIGHLNGELYIDLITDECRFGSAEELTKIRMKELHDFREQEEKASIMSTKFVGLHQFKKIKI